MVRYGRAFQPDALMVGFVLAGLRGWDEYQETGDLGWASPRWVRFSDRDHPEDHHGLGPDPVWVRFVEGLDPASRFCMGGGDAGPRPGLVWVYVWGGGPSTGGRLVRLLGQRLDLAEDSFSPAAWVRLYHLSRAGQRPSTYRVLHADWVRFGRMGMVRRSDDTCLPLPPVWPPPPLVGKGWGGGDVAPLADPSFTPPTTPYSPHPNPPPQGGRETIQGRQVK